MWISKRQWIELEKRISVLEEIEQERKFEADYRKEHSEEALQKAKILLGLGK